MGRQKPMNQDMVLKIKDVVLCFGGRAEVVAAERLEELKQDIDEFSRSQELNGFQRYIIGDMYRFDVPKAGFPYRSAIIVATPVPSSASVVFEWRGESIPATSLARAYPGKLNALPKTKRLLADCLQPMGYHLKTAGRLPLKRLAVCSGLAEYGRNNICYVDGMGSFITLSAYLSDMPCAEDNWRGVVQADCCDGCLACLDSCPTGALRKDRFLIDNERCLSFFNEGPGDFPEWLDSSVHHCLYDCLMCQSVCPMNGKVLGNTIGPVRFNEVETGLLLSGTQMKEFPAAMKKKVKLLGMDQWLGAIPRNMRILFNNYQSINR